MNLMLFTLFLVASVSLVFCGPQKTRPPGQAGDLKIVNKTPFDLVQGNSGSYQMAKWDFPQTISANDEATVHVEFAHLDGDKWEDDAAWIEFAFSGTGQTVKISSQHNFPPPNGHDPNLFTDLAGQHLDLGFKENGLITVEFSYHGSKRMIASSKGQ